MTTLFPISYSSGLHRLSSDTLQQRIGNSCSSVREEEQCSGPEVCDVTAIPITTISTHHIERDSSVRSRHNTSLELEHHQHKGRANLTVISHYRG